jgi:hypothetical protein
MATSAMTGTAINTAGVDAGPLGRPEADAGLDLQRGQEATEDESDARGEGAAPTPGRQR